MRIVLKVSGESLKGINNIDSRGLNKLYNDIKELIVNNELIIVVGGGNFWRGRNDLDINSSISDYIGMLGTVMNSLAISSYLNEKGICTKCYGAFEIEGIIKKGIFYDVENDLASGKVIVFGGGLGIPNLSTDMTTVSKAIEYNADLILMAKNVGGVFDKDPSLDDSHIIKQMTHDELLNLSISMGTSNLLVLDIEALASLAKHKIPLYIYGLNEAYGIDDVINGKCGTKIIS